MQHGAACLLLLLFTLPHNRAEKNATADVERFLRAVEALSNPSEPTLLDAFDALSGKIVALYDAAAPVGDLLADSYNHSLQEGSEQLAALRILHSGMKKLAGEMETRAGNLEAGAKWIATPSRVLIDLIESKVQRMFDDVIQFTDSDAIRRESVMHWDKRPHFFYLRIRTNSYCREDFPSDFHIMYPGVGPAYIGRFASMLPRYLSARRAFRRIEHRFPSDQSIAPNSNYIKLKTQLLTCLTAVKEESKSIARDIMERLERVSAKTAEGAAEEISRMNPSPDDCSNNSERRPVLHDFIIANEFSSHALDLLLQKCHDEFVKFGVFYVMCDRIAKPGKEASRSEYIKTLIGSEFSKALDDATAWIRSAQNVSFPGVGIAASLDAVGASWIDATDKSARTIHLTFESLIGAQREFYQVLTAPAREMNVSWAMMSVRRGDHGMFTHGGIDAHIFRREKNLNNVTEAAEKWLEERRQVIQEAIKSLQAMPVLFSLPSMIILPSALLSTKLSSDQCSC